MDVCTIAQQLSESLYLRLLLLVKAVLCLSGMTAILYLFVKKKTRWIVHPNAKVLYVTHLFWCFVVPLCFGSAYAYDFYRLSLHRDNPCDYTISTRFAFITRIIPVFGIHSQTMNTLAFAIERAVSTLIPTNYETVRSPKFGWILFISTTLTGGCLDYFCLFVDVNWDRRMAVYSLKTNENSFYYQLSLYSFLLLELLAIIVFALALWRNELMYKKYRVARVNSLQNRRLIRTLLPCFAIHFILAVGVYILMISYSWVVTQFNPVSFGIWLETVTQGQFYSLLMPLILLRSLKKNDASSVVNKVQRIDVYFKEFDRYLREKLPRKK